MEEYECLDPFWMTRSERNSHGPAIGNRKQHRSSRLHGIEDHLQVLGPFLPGEGDPRRKSIGHADSSTIKDHQAAKRCQSLEESSACGVFRANVHVAH